MIGYKLLDSLGNSTFRRADYSAKNRFYETLSIDMTDKAHSFGISLYKSIDDGIKNNLFRGNFDIFECDIDTTNDYIVLVDDIRCKKMYLTDKKQFNLKEFLKNNNSQSLTDQSDVKKAIWILNNLSNCNASKFLERIESDLLVHFFHAGLVHIKHDIKKNIRDIINQYIDKLISLDHYKVKYILMYLDFEKYWDKLDDECIKKLIRTNQKFISNYDKYTHLLNDEQVKLLKLYSLKNYN